MTSAAPAFDAPERPLDIDQLYAAYAAAHLSLDWADLVLDTVVERRGDLLEQYAGPALDGDERAIRIVAWLSTLPDRP
jgi:hypothetical protein